MTQTTTDAAALIRATLRDDYGWSSRKVSVRADYFSMGSSIDVTIKDPTVDYRVVEAVAKGQSRVRRDEYSGEILSGGNRYVSVRYSPEADEAQAAPYVALLQAAIDSLSPDTTSGTHADVIGEITVAHAGNGGYRLWPGSSAGMHFGNSVEGGAVSVARYVLDATPEPQPGDFKKKKASKAAPYTITPAPRGTQSLKLAV